MSTLDRHACAGWSPREVSAARMEMLAQIDETISPRWQGGRQATIEHLMRLIESLEAEAAAAYERGRQDERRVVVARLVQRLDAANRRLPMMHTPRLAAVTRGQILEAGDAANEIYNGDHLQATTSEDDQ